MEETLFIRQDRREELTRHIIQPSNMLKREINHHSVDSM